MGSKLAALDRSSWAETLEGWRMASRPKMARGAARPNQLPQKKLSVAQKKVV